MARPVQTAQFLQPFFKTSRVCGSTVSEIGYRRPNLSSFSYGQDQFEIKMGEWSKEDINPSVIWVVCVVQFTRAQNKINGRQGRMRAAGSRSPAIRFWSDIPNKEE
jgi:hypothetical protein